MKPYAVLLVLSILTAGAPACVAGPADQRLAFVGPDGRLAVWSGDRVRTVSSGPVGPGPLAWSPAGDRIALAESAEYGQPIRVRIFPLAGGGARTLELSRAQEDLSLWRSVEALEWPREDRLAVVGSVDPSTLQAAVVDPSTGRILQTASGKAFAWSPRGDSLAAIAWVPHFAPAEMHATDQVEIDEKTVYPPAAETSAGRIRGALLWSPDGRRLAFLVARPGSPLLVIAERQGSVRQIPLSVEGPVDVAAWSDDGDSLLLASGKSRLRTALGSGETVPVSEDGLAGSFGGYLEALDREKKGAQLTGGKGRWWPRGRVDTNLEAEKP